MSVTIYEMLVKLGFGKPVASQQLNAAIEAVSKAINERKQS